MKLSTISKELDRIDDEIFMIIENGDISEYRLGYLRCLHTSLMAAYKEIQGWD